LSGLIALAMMLHPLSVRAVVTHKHGELEKHHHVVRVHELDADRAWHEGDDHGDSIAEDVAAPDLIDGVADASTDQQSDHVLIGAPEELIRGSAPSRTLGAPNAHVPASWCLLAREFRSAAKASLMTTSAPRAASSPLDALLERCCALLL
jgi:hypothetical protein